MVCRPPPHEHVDVAKLTSMLDANLLHLTVEAVREYILFYQRNDRADEVIQEFFYSVLSSESIQMWQLVF